MHFNNAIASVLRAPTFVKRLGAVLRVRGLWLVAALALLAHPVSARAESALEHEYQIKAAYLFNFINYVDWPPDFLPATGDTLTIGIIGENPFGAFDLLKGKTVKGRTLVLKTITSAKDLEGCQIVFISASEKARLADVLVELKDFHGLTVGEIDGFAAQGGVINFVSERNKVRFEINRDAAKRLGLNISSELLKLAKPVKS
jgi:hypothetical protein